MGMFDSLRVPCPKCGKELEYQSKSGECSLNNYTEKNLTPEVAIGIDGDIVNCEFCETNVKLVCKIPRKVEMRLVKTNKKAHYRGNFNPTKDHEF